MRNRVVFSEQMKRAYRPPHVPLPKALRRLAGKLADEGITLIGAVPSLERKTRSGTWILSAVDSDMAGVADRWTKYVNAVGGLTMHFLVSNPLKKGDGVAVCAAVVAEPR